MVNLPPSVLIKGEDAEKIGGYKYALQVCEDRALCH